VRKGLKGREAVAPRKKFMQSMGFFSWRDGTPAKPGRRSRMRPYSLTTVNVNYCFFFDFMVNCISADKVGVNSF
jgi:hypothetical protein